MRYWVSGPVGPSLPTLQGELRAEDQAQQLPWKSRPAKLGLGFRFTGHRTVGVPFLARTTPWNQFVTLYKRLKSSTAVRSKRFLPFRRPSRLGAKPREQSAGKAPEATRPPSRIQATGGGGLCINLVDAIRDNPECSFDSHRDSIK